MLDADDEKAFPTVHVVIDAPEGFNREEYKDVPGEEFVRKVIREEGEDDTGPMYRAVFPYGRTEVVSTV
jgi:hypothetical protein